MRSIRGQLAYAATRTDERRSTATGVGRAGRRLGALSRRAVGRTDGAEETRAGAKFTLRRGDGCVRVRVLLGVRGREREINWRRPCVYVD